MKTLTPLRAFLQSDFHLVPCSIFSGLLMGVFQFSLIQEELMGLCELKHEGYWEIYFRGIYLI